MNRHKYFLDLKRKYRGTDFEGHLVNPYTLDLENDFRAKRFFNQRRKYGFDERETWSLNYTFYAWLYEHLKMYKDVASNIVDLSYHKFNYEGREYSQKDCIDKIIEGCELYLVYDDSGWGYEKMSEDIKKKISDVIPLWGLILPAMWW